MTVAIDAMTGNNKKVWNQMHVHPKRKGPVLVHSCYGDFIVASYESVDGVYQWTDADYNGRINSEKLWHYIWTTLPAKPKWPMP